MRVTDGDRTLLDARALVEPAADVMTRDYYTQLPQIRLSGDSTVHPSEAQASIEIMLDGNDVAKLVECAVRHPTPNMRYAVLAALRNHPDSFRQILQFGLKAPPGFPEIRQIVAEELERCAATPYSTAANPAKPAGEALLPRMPLPAHLRDRAGR